MGIEECAPSLPSKGWGVKKLRFKGREITFVHDLNFDDPIPAHLEASPDAPPIDLMITLVRPGCAFLDVGAHLGTFSMLAAALGARVAAIEANPRQAAMLAAAVERNGFEDFRIVQAAASDHPGTVAFGAWGPWGHVKKETEDDTIPMSDVMAVTVDEVVDQLGWDHVDLIKMDIEGWEPRALRGMRRVLSRDDAPTVIFESNAVALGWYGSTTRDLAAAFGAFGYRLYLIDGLRFRVLIPVAAGDLQFEVVADYLAVKRTPPELDTWTVAAPLSRRAVIARAVAWSMENEVNRRHVATVLRTAAPSLLADRAIRRTLARLRRDPVACVRRAASWSPPSSRLQRVVDRCFDRVDELRRFARRIARGIARRIGRRR